MKRDVEGCNPMNEVRIEVLEEANAHHALVIEELSDQVREQWARIERLERSLMMAAERLQTIEEEMPTSAAKDTRPPHY